MASLLRMVLLLGHGKGSESRPLPPAPARTLSTLPIRTRGSASTASKKRAAALCELSFGKGARREDSMLGCYDCHRQSKNMDFGAVGLPIHLSTESQEGEGLCICVE